MEKLKIPLKLSCIAVFCANLLLTISALTADAKGGLRYEDEWGNVIGYYQSSHALLVGAAAYQKGWSRLPGVSEDIKAVEKALRKHGFTVKVVRDPDHEELKEAFNKFINKYGHESNNRLLFYFAGHGHTVRHASGREMAYIVPVDAPDPKIDKRGFLVKALDMQQFEVYAKRIDSKHALFLFDSCFSGTIFARPRAIPMHISYETAKPARQFITSGSAYEEVPDESIFRHQFIAALDGEGDVNKDGYITATELGEFLAKKVERYSHNTQHPQYGKIIDEYLDKGDFVFKSAKAGAVTQAKLSVEANVRGARVLVDGRVLGSTNLSSTAIMPGEHSIRVEKKGYEPFSTNLQFKKGHAVALIVHLNLKERVRGDVQDHEDAKGLLEYLKGD